MAIDERSALGAATPRRLPRAAISCPRCADSRKLSSVSRASARSWIAAANARAKSSAARTSSDWMVRPSARPAASVAGNSAPLSAMAGFQMTATREMAGTASLRSFSRLPLSCCAMLLNPVTFPPGPARLAVSPNATGSSLPTVTRGIVVVAAIAVRTGAVPRTRTTSTGSATSSAAAAGSRSDWPPAKRASITRSWPTT